MASAITTVEKLNALNYDSWKVLMKSALIYNGLWKYVQVVKPEGNPADWSDEKEQKALAFIILSVEKELLVHIRNAESANDAWKILDKIFNGATPSRKVSLYKKLIQLKCDENDEIAEHITKFVSIVDQLLSLGIKFDDEITAIVLLGSLPTSFENFVIAIETRDELPKLELLKSKIIEESDRQKQTGKSTAEAVLQIKTHNNRVAKQLICYNCNKPGHISRNCPEKQKPKSKFGAKNSSAFSAALSIKVDNNDWVLDSAATEHLSCKRECFVNLTKNVVNINLADGSSIKSAGIGTCKIKCRGNDIELLNALYVPELTNNFISVAKATENGCFVEFNSHGAKITRNGKLLLTATKRDGLFIANSTKNYLYSIKGQQSEADSKLLHRRLGHLNFQSMKQLKGLIYGMENAQMDNFECITCAKGKISEMPYPKKATNRAKSVLEIVHTDICGPISCESMGKAKYFVTFIDDFSRYVKVYFMKSRSEVFDIFCEYKALVENQTGQKIKVLRSDNAKEYKSGAFEKFLRQNGIRHQTSTEYCPQQNGVSERMNRTLQEMARCMILESNLPKSVWAEAISTAAYIRNRCPTVAVPNCTPFEAFTERKPTMNHFKIFGCRAVSLIKGKNLSKFQPRGKELIFVGYCEEQKAYRLLDIRSKTVTTSRNVKFFEEKEKSDHIDIFPSSESANSDKSDHSKMNVEYDYLENENRKEEIEDVVDDMFSDESAENEISEEIKITEQIEIDQNDLRRGPPRKAKDKVIIEEPNSFEEAQSSKYFKLW